ncbi:NHL repeat-containing protein [Paraburkholderia sediminicola]|uniref:hypothetical protein n=1 Tax=Paraburkholderia sediminicola TaxID=458836 RepID=UPI0038B8CE24
MIARSLIASRCGFLHAKRRSPCRNVLRSFVLSAALGMSALSVGQSSSAKDLFIGDAGDSSVKQINASSGAFRGAFVAAGSAGLNGPTGMIFTDDELVVVNQNVGGSNGEIFRFDGETGMFLGKLVASSDLNAPFAPRGIVRGGPDHAFYVADDGTRANDCANQGDVKVYSESGAFLGNLDRSAFAPAFYPRGVVFGPDGMLYVSARGCPISANPNDSLIGYVLRFDPRKKAFADVFASNKTVPDLHRPEGLVFDREGNLWVTSFRNAGDASDTDKILKLGGKTGVLLDKLELSKPGAARAFAQAIIFGPDGKLFIPITGNDTTTTGQLRRCNPTTKVCDNIVQAGGALQQPFYLIFRNSNPATLNYERE